MVKIKSILHFKHILIFTISMCLFSFVKAETLYPYRLKDKWGYCNKQKQIIIPCTYQQTYPFIYGMARVKKNDKYGFINETCQLVIPIEYDNAEDFGFCARVRKNNKSFYIDKTGKETNCIGNGAIDHQQDLPTLSMDEIFKDENNKYGLKFLRADGKNSDTILQPMYDNITQIPGIICYILTLNGKQGVINEKQIMQLNIEYDNISVMDYYGIPMGLLLKKNNLYGYAEKTGKLKIDPKYLSLSFYPNSRLLTVKTTDNKTGFVLEDGTEFF